MKKFLLIALAVVMMMTLAISAFAATDNINAVGGTSTGDVTVNVTDFYAETVYYVDVTWGDLAFNYTQGTYTWDPVNLKYVVKDGSAGWVDENGNTADSVTRTGVIKVTNKSNAGINAIATANVSGAAKVSFDANSDAVVEKTISLGSAAMKNSVEIKDTTTIGEATEGAFDVTVSGTPSGTGNITIATITVAISAVPAA